jgi:hypothetical protein
VFGPALLHASHALTERTARHSIQSSYCSKIRRLLALRCYNRLVNWCHIRWDIACQSGGITRKSVRVVRPCEWWRKRLKGGCTHGLEHRRHTFHQQDPLIDQGLTVGIGGGIAKAGRLQVDCENPILHSRKSVIWQVVAIHVAIGIVTDWLRMPRHTRLFYKCLGHVIGDLDYY